MKFFFSFLILFILFNSFFYSNKSSASWAYLFVVWDGFVYVVSDEFVEEIDKEIGHVTKYSDKEGTYSGNFSNTYKKGTKYYSIKGISTDKAIAIQDKNGKYKKAIRNGEYAGNKNDISGLIFPTLVTVFIILLLFLTFIIFVKRKGER
ncbi:hypothetical protein ACQKP0_12070 [Heyndrickxia sp. NPDC080065]|uniref:hypothetical protein n=1 Tax=Heyndrickxia sp. NPDC080065 TaxID=3390568 RepID=UPI003D092D96